MTDGCFRWNGNSGVDLDELSTPLRIASFFTSFTQLSSSLLLFFRFCSFSSRSFLSFSPVPKMRFTRPQWAHTLTTKLPPQIRLLPFPAVAIILLLVFINLVIWAAVGVVLHYHTPLASTALLSYTLGLRHALDADHISAIDLMTRRLIATGQKPVTVGTFFSLGHSTIVIITCTLSQLFKHMNPRLIVFRHRSSSHSRSPRKALRWLQ